MSNQTKRENPFSLKTTTGALRLLALLLCGVFLFSFLAAVISSDFGQVKVSKLKIDSRGAELDIDQYIPAGTSDADKLPCVILAHGRGATKNVMRGFAEELSRRGFIVLNVNAYGMGLSEQPVSDDGGAGAEIFAFGTSPHGLIDALEFVRTLNYVDPTRIAMLGHSFGSGRSSTAAVLDCGYYTLNDRLINMLADTFQQSFTAEEIAQNADQLAQERLTAEQLAHYQTLRNQIQQEYDTRLNTLILTGATSGPAPSTVSVAGHEVPRECQVNITYIAGMYDSLGAGSMWSADGTTSILGEPFKKMETWYSVSCDGTEYAELGTLGQISAMDNPGLADAFANREARLVCFNPESHSKQYFSSASTADAVRILQEAFLFNNGELKDPATHPIAADNAVWFFRALCNFVAMLCMLGLMFPLVSLLLRTRFFAPCTFEATPSSVTTQKSKAMYWVFAAATVVVTIISLYQANSGGPTWANPFGLKLPAIFTLVSTSAIAFWFVVWLAVCAAGLLAIKVLLNKKATGEFGLKVLHVTGKLSVILKTILMALIYLVFANALLNAIEQLFNQDFRFWQTMFAEMKAEHWLVALPYFVVFLALYVILGVAVNYGANDVFNGKKEMAVTVIVNSLGVWALCLFCYVMWFVNWTGAAISDFTLSYSMLLFVPLTVYIARKMYLMTRSVWLGAAINAVLLSWTLVSSAGIADAYYGQNIISVIFGA